MENFVKSLIFAIHFILLVVMGAHASMKMEEIDESKNKIISKLYELIIMIFCVVMNIVLLLILMFFDVIFGGTL